MDTGKSALGIDGNLAAAIGYPIGILAIICLIMDKENRFVKFHALQSILYHVAAIVIFRGLVILLTILTVMLAFARLGERRSSLWLLYVMVFFGHLAGLIYGAVKSYGGDYFKLPLIGNMAQNYANK